jgi:RimJ/RimL family protein N-acetyltransferase
MPSARTVDLHPISLRSARSVLGGGVLLPGRIRWHPEYPRLETMMGLSMLTQAHRASGWDESRVPCWWMYQLVVAGESGSRLVVGDVGFHSPPGAAGPGTPAADPVVEIGYDVVPSMRGRGIATAACVGIVERAWRAGAGAVRADTDLDNGGSRRVLAKVGFLQQPDGSYLIERPA